MGPQVKSSFYSLNKATMLEFSATGGEDQRQAGSTQNKSQRGAETFETLNDIFMAESDPCY